jgi:hypothetical protein
MISTTKGLTVSHDRWGHRDHDWRRHDHWDHDWRRHDHDHGC